MATHGRRLAPELQLGNVATGDVMVVIAPDVDDMDVVGMNFLSRLKGWRVEDGTLVLTPHHPQPPATGERRG